MSFDDAVLNALAQTLEKDPRNTTLWRHFAELLIEGEYYESAARALRKILEIEPNHGAAQRDLIPVLRMLGELSEALIRAEAMLAQEDDPAIRIELARVLLDRGDERSALEHYRTAIASNPDLADDALEEIIDDLELGPPTDAVQDFPDARAIDDDDLDDDDDEEEDGLLRAQLGYDDPEPQDLAAEFDASDLYVNFQDVAGLHDVKKQINLRIIAPFKNKDIYQAFQRTGGGGILLYGPPGCGKTFIARATAGECDARFVSVGIHTILDKYYGESERLVHALFQDARRRAPTVLFFDEFDALGASRSRSDSQFWRTLVDQLLGEMDGLSGQNTDVLVFAATNLPWNVDAAFRRPGRFDRAMFVPPPDRAARAEIISAHSRKLPGGDQIDVTTLAKRTPLFTGADLKALCERASEDALSKSLETGTVHPVGMADFERACAAIQSSAEEWLATARNYARYSNEAGQFDELTDFLKKVKRW